MNEQKMKKYCNNFSICKRCNGGGVIPIIDFVAAREDVQVVEPLKQCPDCKGEGLIYNRITNII